MEKIAVQNGYHVFQFRATELQSTDYLHFVADIAPEVSEDTPGIALVFPEGTYAYSRTIAFLVRCIKMTAAKGGRLALIGIDDQFIHILKVCSLDKRLLYFNSLEDL